MSFIKNKIESELTLIEGSIRAAQNITGKELNDLTEYINKSKGNENLRNILYASHHAEQLQKVLDNMVKLLLEKNKLEYFLGEDLTQNKK